MEIRKSMNIQLAKLLNIIYASVQHEYKGRDIISVNIPTKFQDDKLSLKGSLFGGFCENQCNPFSKEDSFPSWYLVHFMVLS